jgi:hypothetical protein
LPEIEALAHQAHVSAAWLGEEFKNGQAPAVSAAGLIQRRSRHPPVSGGTKHPNAGRQCMLPVSRGPTRCTKTILRARSAAVAHVLSLTFLSNVVAYVCRAPPRQEIGIMLARLDNLPQRHRSKTLHAAAPEVDFRTSVRCERISGRHDPRSRNSPSRACHAKPLAIGISLAEIAGIAGSTESWQRLARAVVEIYIQPIDVRMLDKNTTMG